MSYPLRPSLYTHRTLPAKHTHTHHSLAHTPGLTCCRSWISCCLALRMARACSCSNSSCCRRSAASRICCGDREAPEHLLPTTMHVQQALSAPTLRSGTTHPPPLPGFFPGRQRDWETLVPRHPPPALAVYIHSTGDLAELRLRQRKPPLPPAWRGKAFAPLPLLQLRYFANTRQGSYLLLPSLYRFQLPASYLHQNHMTLHEH